MWFEASCVTGTIIPSDARSPYSQGYVCGWGCFDSERTRSFSASKTELLVAQQDYLVVEAVSA
jgi:hypothetical protein